MISDALNHASIIDGIRLCKAQRFRYKHADMADLEALCAGHAGDPVVQALLTRARALEAALVQKNAGQ